MASFLHKGYLVVVFAIHDDETIGSWIPTADISWGTDRDRGSHTIASPPTHFNNWPDAETHMLELAKAWIDDRA
jgi:hypothetical protein